MQIYYISIQILYVKKIPDDRKKIVSMFGKLVYGMTKIVVRRVRLYARFIDKWKTVWA